MCANVEHSHTCEHLLVAVKLPGSFPRDAEIPWDDDEILRSLRRGVDTDVVVAEVRFVYGVIERCASVQLESLSSTELSQTRSTW
jgi:hypothetical protein